MLTDKEVQEWMNAIKAAYEDIMGGKKDKDGSAARPAGQKPAAPGFDGGPEDFGGTNAGRGIKKDKKDKKDKKEDAQPNKARDKSPDADAAGGGFNFEGGVPKPGEWKGRGGKDGNGEAGRGGKDKDSSKLHGSDLAFEYANGDKYRCVLPSAAQCVSRGDSHSRLACRCAANATGG